MLKPPSHFVEELESRQLLSASLSHGIITVEGTSGADTIRVGWNAGRTQYVVNVNGVAKSFNPVGVTVVKIYGRAGNDDIRADQSEGAFHTPLFVSGGDGNDTIYGGSATDSLWGSAGDDEIHGLRGDDYISGGAGNDSITGDAGNDMIEGRDGNDTINGGAGVDTIYGDNGVDNLDGGPGADKIYGGKGLDTFAETDAQSEKIDFGLI